MRHRDSARSGAAYQRLLDLLAETGAAHGTTAAAVAVRWVLDQASVAAVILGTGSRSRAGENTAIRSLRLGADEHRRLRQCLDTLELPPGDMYDLERDPDSPHSRIIRTDLRDPASAPAK